VRGELDRIRSESFCGWAGNSTTAFLSSSGPLRQPRLSANVRVDSGVEEGGEVTGFYDPMIAKRIAHRDSRRAPTRLLTEACCGVEEWLVHTNAVFLARLATDPVFGAAEIGTGFIERLAAFLIPATELREFVRRVAARALLRQAPMDPWSTGFRNNAPRQMQVAIAISERSYAPASILMHRGLWWLTATKRCSGLGVSVSDATLGVLIANLGYDQLVVVMPVFIGDTLRG
jgi:acetyl/propionyl-CoA carboxylase alpha subunit